MGSRRWQLPVAIALVGIAAISVWAYLNFYWSESEFLVDQNRRIVRGLAQSVSDQTDALTPVLHTAAWSLYRDGGMPTDPDERKTRWESFEKAFDRSPALEYLGVVPDEKRRDDEQGPKLPDIPKEKDDLTHLTPELSIEDGDLELRFGPLPWRRGIGADAGPNAKEYIRVRVDPERLLEKLRPARMFDTMLIADGRGKIIHTIYERTNGLNKEPFRDLTGLLATAKEPPLTTADATVVASVPHRVLAPIGGRDYWIVFEPIPLTRIDGTPEAVSWTIAGLIRADELLNESRDLPTTSVLLPTIIGLLVVALGYPWLKLWNAGAYEPYGRLELGLAGLSFAGLIGILTAVFYGLQLLQIQEKALPERVVAVLDSIEAGYQAEIGAILDQIESTLPTMRADYDDAEKVSSLEATLRDDLLAEETEGEERSDQPEFLHYPYFNQMFWMDSDGNQRVKWSAKGVPTAAGNYADRAYFKQPRSGATFDFENDDGSCTRYFVEAIRSRSTGESRAVVSVAVPDSPPDPKRPLNACDDRPNAPNVVGVSTVLRSIERPIVPDGIDFLVIGQHEGELRFSSNADARFFEMAEQMALHDFTGCRTHHYHGVEYEYCSFPLATTDMQLVVFGNLESADAINRDALGKFLVGYAVHAGGILLVIAIFLLGCRLVGLRLRADTWMWAGHSRVPACLQLSFAIAALSVGALLQPAAEAETAGAILGSWIPVARSWLPEFAWREYAPLGTIAFALACLLVTLLSLAFRNPPESTPEGPVYRPGRTDWIRAGFLVAVLLAAAALGQTPTVPAIVAIAGILATAGKCHELLIDWAGDGMGLRTLAFVLFGLTLSFAVGGLAAATVLHDVSTRSLADDDERLQTKLVESARSWLGANGSVGWRRVQSVCDGTEGGGWPVYLDGVASWCIAFDKDKALGAAMTCGRQASVDDDRCLVLGKPPSQPTPRIEWHGGWMAIVGAALVLAIIAFARRGLGLSSQWQLDVSTEVSKTGEANWLHIGPTRSIPDPSRGVDPPPQVRTIDLSDGTATGAAKLETEDWVVFQRLEACLVSGERRPAVLDQIASMVRAGHHVHVFCEVDPTRWLADAARCGDETAKRDLSPWSTFFAGFRVRHYEHEVRKANPKLGRAGVKIQRECGVSPQLDKLAASLERLDARDRRSVEDMVLRRGRAEFTRVWELCTDRERALLHLLAYGGVATFPNRQTAAELLRRRLIRRDGGFWIASGAFQRFIVSAASAADRARWTRLAGDSGWGLWRNALLASMMLVLVFVFVTQPDDFRSIGALLAVLGGVPLLARIASGFSSNAPPAER